MPSTLTPNMSLILPTVGTEPSPTWAEDLNSSLTLVDQHNHTPGNGVQITPSGLNINSDLTFLSNNAISLRSVRFATQASPLSLPTDLGCLYESGVDLYFNDGNGNQVRITQSGGVAGSPGSIANLVSPASATYVSATPAFVFQSDANTAANLDGGSLVLRNITANSFGVTLNPPNALAANYSLTLPAALPAAQSFLTLDNSGNIAAAINFSQGITASNIANATITGAKIAAATITQTNLASASVGTAQLIDANVTNVKLAAVNYESSSTINSTVSATIFTDVTNSTTTDMNTVGRPIRVYLNAVSSSSTTSFIQLFNNSGASLEVEAQVAIRRSTDAGGSYTTVAVLDLIEFVPTGSSSRVGPSNISWVDITATSTDNYMYKLQTKVISANTSINITNCNLIAEET